MPCLRPKSCDADIRRIPLVMMPISPGFGTASRPKPTEGPYLLAVYVREDEVADSKLVSHCLFILSFPAGRRSPGLPADPASKGTQNPRIGDRRWQQGKADDRGGTASRPARGDSLHRTGPVRGTNVCRRARDDAEAGPSPSGHDGGPNSTRPRQSVLGVGTDCKCIGPVGHHSRLIPARAAEPLQGMVLCSPVVARAVASLLAGTTAGRRFLHHPARRS